MLTVCAQRGFRQELICLFCHTSVYEPSSLHLLMDEEKEEKKDEKRRNQGRGKG